MTDNLTASFPEEAIEFLAFFKGHHTLTTISQPHPVTLNQVAASYFKLTDFELDLVTQSARNGHDVYFTVNETSPKGRKAQHIESIRAIFADDDKPRKEPRKDWALAPSLVVQTSNHQTGNKYHYYWLTTTENVQQWEQVMQGIVEEYKTDPAVKDLARILRLPGYRNNKYVNRYKTKHVEGDGHVYTWKNIISKFPPLETATVTYNSRNEKIHNEAFNEIAKIDILKSGIHISDPLNSLISHWAHHYSAKGIKDKIDQVYASIDELIMQENLNRFKAAHAQTPKWIRTAKISVEKKRNADAKKNSLANLKVVPIKPVKIDTDPLAHVPIPNEALPQCVWDAAKAVGEYNSNGTDIGALMCMSIGAAVLNKSVKIKEVGENTYTPSYSGLILAMSSGARKSSTFKILGRPYLDYEEKVHKIWEKERYRNQSAKEALDVYDKSLMDKIKVLAKKDGGVSKEIISISKKRADVKEQIENLQVTCPTLIVDDVTEEQMIHDLNSNKGRLAVFADDGRNFIKIIRGKYNPNQTSESVIINSMASGGVLRYNRRNLDDPIIIKNPCLNAFIMLQPDIAAEFRDSEMYKESGLAARLPVVYIQVDVLDLIRKSKGQKLDKEKVVPYINALNGFMHDRVEDPLEISFSKSAKERFQKLNEEYYDLLTTVWQGEYDKTNKMITQARIYSTVCAAYEDPEFRHAFTKGKGKYKISRKYANMGCEYIKAVYRSVVDSESNLHEKRLYDMVISTIKSIEIYFNKGKLKEGFLNNSYLEQKFKWINKDTRHEIMQKLVDLNVLTTTEADFSGNLNDGFPGGKVNINDLIHHYVPDNGRKLLQFETDVHVSRKKTNLTETYV